MHLILGPPGSGKTHAVLSAIAAELAADAELACPVDVLNQPPLLLIAPEQQVLQLEHALLAEVVRQSGVGGGVAAATHRARVLSLSRLAKLLLAAAGKLQPGTDDMARQLLAWRLLPDCRGREAQAEVYGNLFSEFDLYATPATRLEARQLKRPEADSLEAYRDALAAGRQQEALVAELDKLIPLLAGYRQECRDRGLEFTPPPAQLDPELLRQEWPELTGARVWLDGFAGFTPGEFHALVVLLGECSGVTATVPLEQSRESAPRPGDMADWYAPGRELREQLVHAADAAGLGGAAAVSHRWLPEPGHEGPLSRWCNAPALEELAWHGPQPAEGVRHKLAGTELKLVTAPHLRGEVDAACREVKRLAQAEGYRYREISIIVRDLAPYAELLALRLADLGVPHFIDQRLDLGQHPLVELALGTFRLASGMARPEDVRALLRSELVLLVGDEGRVPLVERRRQLDNLLYFADLYGIVPARYGKRCGWLEQDWKTKFASTGDWRCGWAAKLMLVRDQALVAARQLKQRLADGECATVGGLLAALEAGIMAPEIRTELELWAEEIEAEAAASHSAALAAQGRLHRGVADALAELFSQFSQLAGDIALGTEDGMSLAELDQWLQFGCASLSLGYSPPVRDAVLVTDIERGRHPTVRASLVLGMTEDNWPLRPGALSIFGDAERRELNRIAPQVTGQRHPKPPLALGAEQDLGREPYLALVALTRPSEYLYVSTCEETASGSAARPSRYFAGLRELFGCPVIRLADHELDEGLAGQLAQAATPSDAAVVLGCARGAQAAAAAMANLEQHGSPAQRGVMWAAKYRTATSGPDAVGNPLTDALPDKTWKPRLFKDRQSGELKLKLSASRLEEYAECPFKFFARNVLRLRNISEQEFGNLQFGLLYHHALEAAVAKLNESGTDWRKLDWHNFGDLAAADFAVEADRLYNEFSRDRLEHLKQRANLVLTHFGRDLASELAESELVPRLVEVTFGPDDADFAPWSLKVDGVAVEIEGKIDRLDAATDGRVQVVDYKLRGARFEWWKFLAGAQLQLPLYLRVAAGWQLAEGQELEPFQALFKGAEFSSSGNKLEFSATPIPGKQCETGELLRALLAEVDCIVAELVRGILQLEFPPRPLRSPDEKWTACKYCDFRPLCRFDPQAGEEFETLEQVTHNDLCEELAGNADPKLWRHLMGKGEAAE